MDVLKEDGWKIAVKVMYERRCGEEEDGEWRDSNCESSGATGDHTFCLITMMKF